jgi:hypothetical protein
MIQRYTWSDPMGGFGGLWCLEVKIFLKALRNRDPKFGSKGAIFIQFKKLHLRRVRPPNNIVLRKKTSLT